MYIIKWSFINFNIISHKNGKKGKHKPGRICSLKYDNSFIQKPFQQWDVKPNFWPILLRTELYQTYRQVHCKGWGYGKFYTNHCILSTRASCLNLFVTGNYVAKVYCMVSGWIRKTSSFWLFIMWLAKLYHALFPKKDKIEI